MFIKEGAEKNSDRIKMENFYYTAVYYVLQEPGQHAAKAIKLKVLKAKIIRLNNSYRQRVMLDTTEQDRIDGEPPSLHHIIKTRKRQTNLLIDHSR